MTQVPVHYQTDSEIQIILREAKTIAVVGASSKPWRDSLGIMQFLMNAGYTVIPVNPNYSEILGEPCYPDLKAVPHGIDIVDIFRHPDEVMSIVDDAIVVNAKTVWFQIGVVNERAAVKAYQAGLNIVMNRCIAVDYKRLHQSFIK